MSYDDLDTEPDYGAMLSEPDVDHRALLDCEPEVNLELEDGGDATGDRSAADAPDSEDDLIDRAPDGEEQKVGEAAARIEEKEPEGTAQVVEIARAIDPAGAPVVAVCGLSGGAGTSTVAMMLAYASAEQKSGEVLLADLGGPSSSIAAYLSKCGPHSLASAANAHRAGLFGEDGETPFAEITRTLLLLAREPGLADDQITDAEDPYLYDLLVDAQEDHFATFIDCGRLEQPAEIAVAEHATHLVWVTSAAPSAARRARAALNSLPFKGARDSFLIVRVGPDGQIGDQAERDIRIAADLAEASVVMMPDAGDIVAQGLGKTARNALRPLKATLGRIFE